MAKRCWPRTGSSPNFLRIVTYDASETRFWRAFGDGFAGIGSARANDAPYKGTAPALIDLLGGHLDFMCDQTINVLQPAKSGLFKAFAATTPQRLKVAPELPIVAEAAPSDGCLVCAERDAEADHR